MLKVVIHIVESSCHTDSLFSQCNCLFLLHFIPLCSHDYNMINILRNHPQTFSVYLRHLRQGLKFDNFVLFPNAEKLVYDLLFPLASHTCSLGNVMENTFSIFSNRFFPKSGKWVFHTLCFAYVTLTIHSVTM